MLAERARLDFVLCARRAWANEVYPVLTQEVRRAAPAAVISSRGSADWEAAAEDVAPYVHAASSYPFFAWLERGLQRQLWRAVDDLVGDDNRSDGDRLPPGVAVELDENLELPDWYTACDFHLQPGGVWRSARNALVYRLGARVVMLGGNDGGEFHRLFTATAVPDRAYRRIVDLGCGFGKSTLPFKERFPDAEVIGVDLAGPLVQLGHAEAVTRDLAVRFRQADCRDTGLEPQCADLVSATMLVHELPPAALRETLREVVRLLAPGGLLRVLDFHPTGDPIRDLAMLEHSDRNNEPFLKELFHADLLDWCEEAGLSDARWVAFDERGAGRLDAAVWPRRSEWHFPWAVLEAQRP